MIAKRDTQLLLNGYFLTALVVLICNDQIWKYTYANALTGKLSDIAGLILLPPALAFLFPRLQGRAIGWSALFFILWKTPWASPLIEWYNTLAPMPISRVVDYTDYLALLVLPLPYWLIIRDATKMGLLRLHPILAWSLLLLTSSSFIATQPPIWYSFQQSSGNVTFYGTRYRTGMTESEVLAALAARDIDFAVDTAFANNVHLRYYWRNRDSILSNNPPFYHIPELVIEDDTLHEVQFSLMPQQNGNVMFLLNGLQVDDLAPEDISRKLRRMYRRQLKKELVQSPWK